MSVMAETELEIELGPQHAVNPALLERPSKTKLGGERGAAGSPQVRLRTGRSPLVRNLRELHKSRGGSVPEDFEIFWRHGIWVVQHTVAVDPGGSADDVEQFCCELRFPAGVTVIDVLPDARFIQPTDDGFRCDSDLRLNGRATAAGPAIRAGGTAGAPVVERISMPVATPYVQAIGIGDSVVQFVFSRHSATLTGEQTLVETILTEKYADELPWAVRMHAVLSGSDGLPVRLRSNWVPLFTRLETAAGS
jgi:hypothetical protein